MTPRIEEAPGKVGCCRAQCIVFKRDAFWGWLSSVERIQDLGGGGGTIVEA